MWQILLSIVIPIYNKANNLEKCLDSILGQNFENYEIILIDDCSTDKSVDICLAYKKKDGRIRLFCNKSNLGPGETRNRGISLANGKYIMFIDADDYIEKNAFSTLMNMTNEVPDLNAIIFGYRTFSNEGEIEKFIPSEDDIDCKKKIQRFIDLWGYNPVFGSPCNKIYSLKCLKSSNIKFPKNQIWAEDFMFNLNFFSEHTFVKVIPKCLYNYRKGISSLTTTYKEKKINVEDFKKVVDKVSETYLLTMQGYESGHKYYWLQSFYFVLLRIAAYNMPFTKLKLFLSDLCENDHLFKNGLKENISKDMNLQKRCYIRLLQRNHYTEVCLCEKLQTNMITLIRKMQQSRK